MDMFMNILSIVLLVFSAAVTVFIFYSLVVRYRGNLPHKTGARALFIFLVLAMLNWGFVAIFGVWSSHTLSVQHIKQGLDLQGGVTILYEADDKNATAEEMETALSVIRTRLDAMGQTEADCAIENQIRIRVDIPGESDAANAISSIGATAELTFVDPDGNVVVRGDQITRATATTQTSQQGGAAQYVVAFELNSEATRSFSDATQKYLGQEITIYLDDTVISNPRVNSAITGGSGIIEGNFTLDSAKQLAAQIRSGSMPVKLSAISSSDVGAKLGADSLNLSLWAGLVGGVVVLLFMLLVYRAAGLAADIALMFYLFIEVMIMSAFGVTLTLPGIAGMVLSIGMAVDANVIIFERLKEELKLGRSLRYAIDIAHGKAFSAILDGNVTTLIAAAVLYWLGTGTIKGFAVTLGIGIVVSMFSALVITRGILKCIAGMGIVKPWMYGVNASKSDEGAKGGETA